MGVCPSKPAETDSMRDGTWFQKHVAQTSPELPMHFDKNASSDYAIAKKIDSGMQGAVYAATCRSSGDACAIKETHIGAMTRGGERRKEAYAELETLSRMRHENVVHLREAYQTSTELQLAMERVEGTGLIRYLVECDEDLESVRRTEKEVREEKFSLMRQLVDAVAHVHARNVCFRDLQPENVMVTSGMQRKVKLIDFGRAVVLKRKDVMEKNLKPMGTSLFQAPEVERKAAYGQASDMWAVGVFLYLLVSNKMPFSRTVEGVYAVLRGEYEPFDHTFSKQARDLISKLLVVNPKKRINAAQANQHRYLRKFKDLKQTYQEAGMNVSRERSILVPSEKREDAERSLVALEEKTDIIKQCVPILCELKPQDVATLHRWLNMSAEKSVHGTKIGLSMKRRSDAENIV